MNYSDYMIVEKWKDTSTDDIKTVMEFTKSMAKTKTKNFNFYVGLIFFMIFPTILIVFSNFTVDSMFLFTIIFASYYIVWKFFLEKKYYDKEFEKELNVQIEEFETVLKYR